MRPHVRTTPEISCEAGATLTVAGFVSFIVLVGFISLMDGCFFGRDG